MASETATNGITANMPNYFQSISLSSSNPLNGLATDLSEMAIGDRPPPRKIRRRNALTPTDPHYPLVVPPPNSPVHDAFEDSSRMQALDEIVHRDFTVEDDCYVIGEPKRKIAGKSKGPRIPGEDREVRQILLHRDLENFQVEQCLPETLVRKYVKAVKSSLHNPCSALVPYQPPEKLLSDILKGKDQTLPSSATVVGDMETDE